jgi:dTMP kinase
LTLLRGRSSWGKAKASDISGSFAGRRAVPARATVSSVAIAADAPSPGPPRFVSFEGVDGSGKSTQARLLAAHLRSRGGEVVELREPGGTAAGERIRALLLDPEATLAPRAEALLFAAARAQVVAELIAPALARGAIVVADRFVDSSLVYQGLVRGLGLEHVRAVNHFATDGFEPDRTVLLELDPPLAERRRAGFAPDRIESETGGFQERVARGYAELARDDAPRILRVDAAGSQDEVARRVREALGV